MEIRIRPLLVVLAIGAVVAVVALFGAPRLAQLLPAARTTPAGAVTVTPGATPIGGVAITYGDESLGWDWEVSCEPQLRQFLAEKLFPALGPGPAAAGRISAVKIVLVDVTPDSKLPFGVRYPDEAGAQANANCSEIGPQTDGGGAFTCRVGVARGEPGADLDVAATLAAPYTLLDMFLARGAHPDAVRRTWRWGTFQPLIAPIEEAENQWQSTCLRVSRAQ